MSQIVGQAHCLCFFVKMQSDFKLPHYIYMNVWLTFSVFVYRGNTRMLFSLFNLLTYSLSKLKQKTIIQLIRTWQSIFTFFFCDILIRSQLQKVENLNSKARKKKLIGASIRVLSCLCLLRMIVQNSLCIIWSSLLIFSF